MQLMLRQPATILSFHHLFDSGLLAEYVSYGHMVDDRDLILARNLAAGLERLAREG